MVIRRECDAASPKRKCACMLPRRGGQMPTEELIDKKTAEDFPADDVDDESIESEMNDTNGDDPVSDDDAQSDDSDEADGEGEVAAALDELEAEELDMLTEDETSETLVVDEAAEMRQIRREELAMDRKGADEATDDEFVCNNCFLVLKTSQLADSRRKICRDCAA